MSTKQVIITSLLAIILLGFSTMFFSNTSLEKKEHFVQVKQKISLNKGEYMIHGSDPYIYESPTVEIMLDEDQWNVIQKGQVYYMKYEKYDDKPYKLKSYELKK